jgi:two-component system, OmpR family, copper resistance phosphate regulon response regulator CusR
MIKIKILLMIGEKMIAGKLCELFAGAKYAVDLALDGSAGKSFFERHSYDLVLVDFELPDIGGCKVCQYIRGKDEYIPIFMLSCEKGDHRFEAFHVDVDDYLVLSDDFRELLIRTKVLAKRLHRPVSEESKIVAGDIVMDLDSKQVLRGDSGIMLSAREFLLLQYLLRNKNRVVSREEIVCTLWEKPGNSKGDRVPAFMHSLRLKVDNDKRHRFIYTVRGKGYMLAE